jgi:hypothetical protein
VIKVTFLLVALLFCQVGWGQTDVSFFASSLYPVLQRAECRKCHQDNGVASTTRLQFPPEDATSAEITSFGLSLKTLADTGSVEQSLLLRKPTRRMRHAGGQRIDPGSDEEQVLRTWIEYLAAHDTDVQLAGDPAVRKAPIVLRRLTRSQYNNSLRELMGDQTRPADDFPAEDYVHGFTNQAEGQSVSPLLAEAWNRAAEKAARLAFIGGDSRGLIPCQPADAADAECREMFIRRFGARAFRRPLTEAEVRLYGELFVAEAAGSGSFTAGAQAVVEAVLQSPYFLFHLEGGPDDRLTSYRVASRLSYFLWNTMPDDELFRAAERGELSTREGIESQARRLLADPRARGALHEFLTQWLRFDRLHSAVRDRRLFPEFSDELVADMAEEVRQLFDHLVWEGGNFLDFFRADYAFLSSSLARLYGLEAPDREFGMVRFPEDSERGGGVLGTALFLSLTSKPVDTSPTERGLFIREHFLGQVVPPPPPGVDMNLPPSTEGRLLTNRERLGIHLSSPNCAACHDLIDPIGFGLERFDAIGRYRPRQLVTIFPTAEELRRDRDREPRTHELELDVSASVRGIPDSEFSSPRQLGAILAANKSCQRCVVKQLFRYALGRQETAADQPLIDAALADFERSGFQFQSVVLSIALSDTFLGDLGR